jgi:hypothetical protein
VMWRHGDMATSNRHGSFDERGGAAKCRRVAVSPRQRFVVGSFGPASVAASLLPLLGSSISVPASDRK